MKHMSVNIEGAMNNVKMFVGNITVDGKTLQTEKDVKDYFQSQLDLGRRVLPLGNCDNFDYQTGCLGHEKVGGKRNDTTGSNKHT